LAIFIFDKKGELAERASIEKIIQTNPYTAFDEALICKCDKAEIITPYLKVVSLLSDSKASLQKWLIANDKQHFFVFQNDTDQCQPFNFKKDDLILIKGKLTYSPENIVLALSRERPSYLEYQGKRFCENK
jgi:hypothetical protein